MSVLYRKNEKFGSIVVTSKPIDVISAAISRLENKHPNDGVDIVDIKQIGSTNEWLILYALV